jgi:iron complex transport system substrate-binding protein
MTQGATEFLLSLGLAKQMVGTAYLDDSIWPKYATEYSQIPVLSSAYPNETTIMGTKPDFIVASFNSAFRQTYQTDKGQKGIFSNTTFGKNCTGAGGVELGMKELASNDRTCRKELNSKGIGTFLFQDACENKALRPTVVSEAVVYEEMRALGKIFKVDVEHLVKEMGKDFDAAQSLVSTNMHGKSLKAVWLDCVGRCCPVKAGEEPEVFVGVKSGAPGMLMREAGLSNVFADVEGNWKCVKEKDVIAAAPDVIIVVDAAWDTALGKLTWLYNHSAFCEMDVLKAARLVQIPFSATSLSPRNGAAARDLAIAAIRVRTGTSTPSRESGVSSFNPGYLATKTAGLRCSLDMPKVVYDKSNEATTPTENNEAIKNDTSASTKNNEATTPTEVASEACGLHFSFVWFCLALAYAYQSHVY